MRAEHRQEMDEQLLQACGIFTSEENSALLGLSGENALLERK
jgi:hypothetical protein